MYYTQSRFLWVPQYEFSSCGKHGDRYKRKNARGMPVVRVYIKTCEINQRNFQTLSLLSSNLSEGLQYKYRESDGGQDMVFIELVAASDVEKLE